VSADALLSRLENVRRTGAGRWIARCPAHDDRRASMSIRELEDGTVLLHDFAGCEVAAILAAVSLDMAALFPERSSSHGRRERRPFAAADVLRCIGFEALIVAVAAENMAAGKALSSDDLARLRTAAARLKAAANIHDE